MKVTVGILLCGMILMSLSGWARNEQIKELKQKLKAINIAFAIGHDDKHCPKFARDMNNCKPKSCCAH
jgi:hypothetical protein